MTTVSDAVKFLADRPGFDRRMTRADRRNASRALYRAKKPPKISADANAAYTAGRQAQREALERAVEAENRAVAELMRTQKTRPEEGMTISVSGG